jgi:hypothetical protein
MEPFAICNIEESILQSIVLSTIDRCIQRRLTELKISPCYKPDDGNRLYGPDRVPIDNFMIIVKLQVPLYPAWHSQASN